jgi:hypothetical protein
MRLLMVLVVAATLAVPALAGAALDEGSPEAGLLLSPGAGNSGRGSAAEELDDVTGVGGAEGWEGQDELPPAEAEPSEDELPPASDDEGEFYDDYDDEPPPEGRPTPQEEF